MNSSTVVCPQCKKSFEISEAFQHRFNDELQRAIAEQSESLRKEFSSEAEERVRQAVKSAVADAEQAANLRLQNELQTARLELDRAKQSTELELERARQATELETERLRSEAAASKESERQLREELSKLLDELSKANKARENAEIAARKEMLNKENLIREEVKKQASDDFNTQIRAQEETISRLRVQLTEAKQVAEQGSQQLQGEILETDIEKGLRAAFPFDDIEEVKKGERGADIRQVVNERLYMNCGLVIWECKNAKNYQAAWLDKLKDELAEEKAQIGVIVFNPTSGGGDDFKQLSENIWLVKPRYAVMLATLLREVLVKVFIANRNAEGKDVKTELIYNYLTGGEFSNRIRYIIESYDEMQDLLKKAKKQAEKRWAAQEQIIQKVVKSIYGMSGDLEGIAGKEIVALPTLESDDKQGIVGKKIVVVPTLKSGDEHD